MHFKNSFAPTEAIKKIDSCTAVIDSLNILGNCYIKEGQDSRLVLGSHVIFLYFPNIGTLASHACSIHKSNMSKVMQGRI